MKILEANDLFAGYGKTEILHGVSLQLAEREIITIIGPNGAGKSTLLKAIMGYISIFKGEVLWKGENITSTGSKGKTGLRIRSSTWKCVPLPDHQRESRDGGIYPGKGVD